MKLVIVESPTKAKTVGRFLGKEYRVLSSYGHVRDLPKSTLGIDVKSGFAPSYVIIPRALPVVADLKKESEKAALVILATDEDREGEAIAWHLTQALDLGSSGFEVRSSKRKAPKDDSNSSNLKPRTLRVQRIAFHEITEQAIRDALAHPRAIDMRLVDAQQARRILDRLVGYELSPFIWRKVRYGLSAGRVQSVAVRLVVERERDILNFTREAYWTIDAVFSKKKDPQTFPAKLYARNGKTLAKMGIRNEAEAARIVSDLEGARYAIGNIETREVRRTPPPPFTTSTMQQDAARKLGYSAKQTMLHAQRLYENGHITYMRTDSVALSSQALAQAKKIVTERFGDAYALETPRAYATKSKGAQEAHEAIRPTDLSKKESNLKLGEKGQRLLYDLIWKRTVASQMALAIFEQTTADIPAIRDAFPNETHPVFRANGQTIKFDGFLKAYREGKDESESDEAEGMLPSLVEGEPLELSELAPHEHFTEPPPRYTDATLIKALEAAGVGRPSTYAPILSTIQDRGYAEKVEKKYHPTETGIAVNDLLVEHFPEIVDINFTSHVEEELDEIAEGKIPWVQVCKEFYDPFKAHLAEKEATVGKLVQISETPCPHCGNVMLIKFGRMGKFLACPDPENKFTMPMPEEAAKIRELEERTKDERCPICGKPMAVKRGRFGFFLGCSEYPECKGLAKIWNKSGFACLLCGETPERRDRPGDIVEKKSRGRGRPFWACTRYPECSFLMNKKPESEAELVAALLKWKENSAKPKPQKVK